MSRIYSEDDITWSSIEKYIPYSKVEWTTNKNGIATYKFFDKDGMIVAKIIWNPDEPGDVNKVKIIGTMRNVIKDKVEPMDFTWEVPGRALINVTRWSRNSDVESRH